MSEFEHERAKRLFAAVMSSRLGTSFQTEYKRVGKTELAEIWYVLAERLDQIVAEMLDSIVKQAKNKQVVH